YGQGGCHRIRPRGRTSYYAGTKRGRCLVSGESGRLQGGTAGDPVLRPHLSHDDDRGRSTQGSAGGGAWGGGGGLAGHCHGAPPWRGGVGIRCASFGQGTG